MLHLTHPINLTVDERKRLHQVLTQQNVRPGCKRQARAVLLMDGGANLPTTARQVKLTREGVRQIRMRFMAQRLRMFVNIGKAPKAQKPAGNRGRPRTIISMEDMAKLMRRSLTGDNGNGLPESCWKIAQDFKISPHVLNGIWRRNKLTYRVRKQSVAAAIVVKKIATGAA